MNDCVWRQEGIRYVLPECVFSFLERLKVLWDRGWIWQKRFFTISFLFFTGARASEAVEVRRRDVRLASLQVVLPTLKKRRKVEGVRDVRVIYLNHVPVEVLEYWEKYLGKFNDDDKIIRLTRFGVHKLVRSTFREFGIGRVHPHMLRHAIGIWLIKNYVPVTVVADFLGHSNLHMVMRYARIAGVHMQRELRRIGVTKITELIESKKL